MEFHLDQKADDVTEKLKKRKTYAVAILNSYINKYAGRVQKPKLT